MVGVSTFVRGLGNPVVMVIVFATIFSLLWLLDQSLWSYLIILTSAYNASGWLTLLWGKTRRKGRFLSSEPATRAKGHAFFFFMSYVIMAAVASNYLAGDLVQLIETESSAVLFGITIPYFSLAVVDLAIVLFTYIYFHYAVYKVK